MCPTPQRFHTVLHFEYSRGDNNFNFSSWLGYVNMSFRDLMKYYLFGIYLVPKLRQARLARQQDAGVAPAILLQHQTASGKPMQLPALCIIFGIVYNISEGGGGGQICLVHCFSGSHITEVEHSLQHCTQAICQTFC